MLPFGLPLKHFALDTVLVLSFENDRFIPFKSQLHSQHLKKEGNKQLDSTLYSEIETFERSDFGTFRFQTFGP